MPDGLSVLFVAVEMSPLVKVGGLADVMGSLPRALRRLGADVRVVLPFHAAIDRTGIQLRQLAAGVTVRTPAGPSAVSLWETTVQDTPVFLVESEHYFGRPQVYGYDDDLERWLFFDDAVLALAARLGWRPDILHLHDWHSALVATRLLAQPEHTWANAPTVFTVHNLSLQGPFDADFRRRHGFPAAAFRVPHGVDAGLALGAVAQGVLHTDLVTTVSETYALEVLTPEYGEGLDPLLRARQDRLVGIINGIDYEVFDPATDPDIAANYDAQTLDRRVENKRALQGRLRLPQRDVLLAAMVTRLYHQKGSDLAALAFEALLARRDIQFAVLGTGDKAHEKLLTSLRERFPDKVGLALTFDAPLGQLFYAGCDAFLMPSRFEPCGLGQLIALRYGAVPVVRRTGGLADSVVDVDVDPGGGTGFVFGATEADVLLEACRRAMRFRGDGRGQRWAALIDRGMTQDFSWESGPAPRYLEAYRRALALRAG